VPRSPIITARRKLEEAVRVDKASEVARRKARENLYAAMVSAVEAGITRYAVARIAGVSNTRVSQVPGMPVGKNGRPKTSDE